MFFLFSFFCWSFYLTAISEFVLTAIHTKPDAAVTEIDALRQVHSELKRLWNTDNILILGDLNAACSYASATALKKLEIRKDPQFLWLIPDKTDTTATASDCTYDRLLFPYQITQSVTDRIA